MLRLDMPSVDKEDAALTLGGVSRGDCCGHGKDLLPCMGSLKLVVCPVRILVAVVHYWDPEGSWAWFITAQSRPRIEAFQQQLLGLMRLSQRQAQLTMQTLTADPANKAFQHQIDIQVITDGEHHVLVNLIPFRGLFQMVVAKPEGPKHLGFEAQGSGQSPRQDDLYAYFEDDPLFLTQDFSGKLIGFAARLVMIACCCLGLNSPQFLMLSIVSLLTVPFQMKISVG